MATYTLPMISDVWLEVIRRGVLVVGMLMGLRLLAKIAITLVRFYLRRTNGYTAFPNTSIFENFVRIGIFLIGFLMLLETFGISVVPICFLMLFRF